jgi:pimeloyl-ACP methyl ester carboxylesterase
MWPGEGLPLVLLHGLYDNAEGWDVLAGACNHPCLCFDLPGFGDSDLRVHPTYTDYAADICEAITQLRIQDFAVIGHSLGGGRCCCCQ